jgi:hypothetical protein
MERRNRRISTGRGNGDVRKRGVGEGDEINKNKGRGKRKMMIRKNRTKRTVIKGVIKLLHDAFVKKRMDRN